jgi:hypothetical protein
VDFGDGNDTINSDVVNLTVNFGNGNDTVLHAGAGSIINLGTGQDKVAISNDILVTGATANDIIATADGHVEHGAVGSLNSESGWIVGPDGTRYGLDTQGDLEIKDAVGDITTVANYVGGYNVGLSQQTAGIFVGRAAVNAYRLLEPKPDTPFNNISTRSRWAARCGSPRAASAETREARGDPREDRTAPPADRADPPGDRAAPRAGREALPGAQGAPLEPRTRLPACSCSTSAAPASASPPRAALRRCSTCSAPALRSTPAGCSPRPGCW